MSMGAWPRYIGVLEVNDAIKSDVEIEAYRTAYCGKSYLILCTAIMNKFVEEPAEPIERSEIEEEK
jgi:hypothetical protein